MAQFHLKSQPVQAQPQHVCYTAPCLPTSIFFSFPLLKFSLPIFPCLYHPIVVYMFDFFFITAEDYELTKTTLRLMPGNVRRDCVLITIIDDDESEGVESFTVTATLVQSTITNNMITIAPTEALVLINDNDNGIYTIFVSVIFYKF